MKFVCKLTPTSLYDVCGLEKWLENMARRGLKLKKLRPAFSSFEKGPALSIRYRLEPFCHWREDAPPQDMLELYQDFGWTLAGETAELLIFTTQDPEAPEPHSDPELQGQLWKKLYRSKRRLFFLFLAADLLFLAAILFLLFWVDAPLLFLLTSTVPALLFYFLLHFATLQGNWGDIQRLSLMIRQLEAGVPLEHRSFSHQRPWNKLTRAAAAAVLLAAFAAAHIFLPFAGRTHLPLEELTAFTPLSLSDVEGVSRPYGWQSEESGNSNYCNLDRNLLCPEHWMVSQSISEGSRAYLSIYWYGLPRWLSPLAVPLARELANQTTKGSLWYEHNGGAWIVEYRPREGIDFLATAYGTNFGPRYAIAAAENKVVEVLYTGENDLTEHLDAIMDMVK